MDVPRPDPTTPAVISVSRVSKRFVDARRKVTTDALNDTSFVLHRREFISLLGPSGCGKTTLLNIVAGFDTPTGGKALLSGEPISGPGPERGVIFQSPNLFPWLSVIDNVMFGPRLRKENSREVLARAEKLLDLIGLERFKNHFPYEISGGMQQRVAYARVLVNEPQVVLADEPFAALDEHTRRRMQRDFEEVVQKTQTTVLFVTHSIEEAVFLSDRVLVMTRRPGTIKAEVEIGFPRPRDRTSEAFLETQSRILRLLEEEVAEPEATLDR